MSQPKKSHQRIEHITTWTKAFGIFSLILVSHFPHRWRDLLQYQLLILCTHQHFHGRVRLAYDRAFREHTAATQFSDCSCMNTQLFNFHAVGASVRPRVMILLIGNRLVLREVLWFASLGTGRCTSPLSICHYTHRCSSCSGSHRAAVCPTSWPKYPREEGKGCALSPSAVTSSSGSKSCHA